LLGANRKPQELDCNYVFSHFICKKLAELKDFLYICSGIGEKSRTADALAYYFALTEDA